MTLKEKLYKDILPFVQKPVRYSGGEYNSVVKAHASTGAKFLLAFPEVYEIGMSYLGLKILYGILNGLPNCLAERAFSPWPDMEKIMREQGAPLYSLETFTPAKEFDCIGITLQYEMTFTNVLQLLDLSGLEFLASKRKEEDPVILGGGPSAFNPEPLADFFDLFIVGDGEESMVALAVLFEKKKKEKLSKKEFLKLACAVEGAYVPSFYSPEYAADGTVKSCVKNEQAAPDRVRKAWVRDLDKACFPVAPVVPYMNVVQDRVTLEIMRGCARGCRFCVSGMSTRPVRERSVNKLMELARASQADTGYNEISLSSLSSTDHSGIEPLAEAVESEFSGKHVSISLPSSRIDAFSASIAAKLSKVRRSTLTFALEAATEKLRAAINKPISEADVLSAAEKAFAGGWENIKMYFMLGLPGETEADILAIGDLAKKINQLGRQQNKRFRGLTVNVAFFVPKPHTPFQWMAQDTGQSFKQKIDVLRKVVNPKWIKWHSVDLSALEGVFARGDRRLSGVLLSAYNKGARFDAWHELFSASRYAEAFKENGLDPAFYANRERTYEEVLPWDLIDTGVRKEFLKEENEKSKRAETTPYCAKEACNSCGLEKECASVSVPGGIEEPRITRAPSGSALKIRVKYAKTERAKFISHLDALNTVHHILMRTGMPVVFSDGFNPHVKTAFSPALSVGVSSEAESFDFELYGSFDRAAVEAALKKASPEGIRIISAEKIPAVIKSEFSYAVYEADIADFKVREGAKLPETVEKMEAKDGKLYIGVRLNRPGPSNIFKLLALIVESDEITVKKIPVKRIKLF